MQEITLPPNLRQPRLRRAQVPEYLRLKHGIEIAVATLAKKASCGGGPAYHKSNGSPLYPVEELDKWALQRLGPLQHSTSDKGRG